MKIENQNKLSSLGRSLEYVGKLFSSAIIVILLLIGAFLIYCVISAKKDDIAPKVSLYTIVSGSMEPSIKVFDIIFDVRIDDPSKIKNGDVITFKSSGGISNGKIVTHRVVDVKLVNGKYEFVTKGDSNPTADSATVKEDDLIGKTIFKIPQLGRIQLFIGSKMGWIMLIFIPALGIIIYDIFKLFKIFEVKESASSIKKEIDADELTLKDDNKMIEETIEKIKKRHLLEKNE